MRQILLKAANLIADAESHPAPLPEDQAAGFDSVAEAGWIDITEDHISFATPELLVNWIARYCALNISDVWQDLAEANQALRKAKWLHVKLKLPKSFWAHVFTLLEKEYGKCVLSRLEEAARIEVGVHEANHALKAIYFAFCEALPELDYQPDDLAHQLGPVLKATESYLPAGLLHGAIERLAGRSQEKAQALIEAFLAQPERRSAELVANALRALWAFDPVVAHKQAMELTAAVLPSLQRIGAITLAWFSYELPLHEREVAATICRLEELCESGDPEVLPATTQAFGTLIASSGDSDKMLRIKEGFLRLASNEEPAVQCVAAHVLSRCTDDSADADWFWDAIGRLSGVSAQHQETLDRLDLTTYSMVERYPDRVLRHLEGVVTNRPYGREGEKDGLPDLYENTVVRLIEVSVRSSTG